MRGATDQSIRSAPGAQLAAAAAFFVAFGFTVGCVAVVTGAGVVPGELAGAAALAVLGVVFDEPTIAPRLPHPQRQTGSVNVVGTQKIRVTVTKPTILLSTIGIGQIDVTKTATADLVQGITSGG